MMSSRMPVPVVLATAITVFCWSSAFVGIRFGLTHFHPGSLALLRFLVASLCMFAVFKTLPRPEPNHRSAVTILKIMGLGAIGMGLYNILLGTGETTVSSGVAGFVASQIPVFSALLAVIVLKEKISAWGYCGFIVSTIGVGLIVLQHESHIVINAGALYVLSAAFCAALFFVLQKPLLLSIKPLYAVIYAVWGATLALSVFSEQLIQDLQHATPQTILTAVYLGVFPTCIAYATWNYALSRAPAITITSSLYLMPPITCLLGWVLLGEVLTFKSLIGGLCAVFGAMLISKGLQQQPHKEEKSSLSVCRDSTEKPTP